MSDNIQQRKLIKALARRGEFPEWKRVWDLFDEIASEPNDVGAAAAIGMSMLTAANFPAHMFYGAVPDVWNESEDE